MSRKSEAKQARRRKRQTTRDSRWIPDSSLDTVDDHGLADEVASAAKQFDSWITSRGWHVDADNATDEVVSWVYPPSAVKAGEGTEPVTRVWIAILGGDDDFPERVGAVLAGAGPGEDGVYSLRPAQLVDHIEQFEAYRPGAPMPAPTP